MFDPLKSSKQKLELAESNARAARNYSSRRFARASQDSKTLLASPQGILGAFAAGSVKGASSGIPTPPSSLLFQLLLKFF